MANYKILIKPSAVKELETLPRKNRARLIAAIQGLSTEPRPAASEKLSGHELYRVRRGSYRVLYDVDDSQKTLVVVKIGHRRDVYR